MPKLSLSTINSGYASVDALNANFDAIEAAIENTLSRDGTSPNTMSANLDMNSHRILNLPVPLNASEAARLADVQAALAGGSANLITFSPAGTISATTVQAAIEELDTEKASASAFMQTVLDDTTAADARTTLGAAASGPLASSGITGALAAGAVTTSGLTMATSRLLGRTTAGTGAIEELPFASSPLATNLKGSTSGNAAVNITADRIILISSSGVPFVATSVNVTPSITASGANGLDTGSEAPSTWYYVWVIANASGTVAGLLSTSASAPTMPSGYIYRALVSAVRNDSGSDFVGFFQAGSRVYLIAEGAVVSSGTATSETTVSTASFVPPAALSAELTIRVGLEQSSSATATVTLFVRLFTGNIYGRATAGNVGAGGSSFSSNYDTNSFQIPNRSQEFIYNLSGSTGSPTAYIWVNGFSMPIGA